MSRYRNPFFADKGCDVLCIAFWQNILDLVYLIIQKRAADERQLSLDFKDGY